MSKFLINRLSLVAAAAFFVFIGVASAFGQTLYDSFTDGDFTTNPTWTGTTTSWTVVANSDVAAGAAGSNTLRLSAPAVSGTEFLSSQIANWGTSQEWGVFLGRRAQAYTAANQQYFWLYANEATLTSATVDGYRLAIGDDSGNDEIRLEYIVNGAVNTTVIVSTGAIPNGLTDIGLLVRVTRSATGDWQLFTSTLPTVSGTGAVATDIPNSTNASISQGTGTNNLLVPAANGFIGVAALHSTGAVAIAAAEFDQIYFTPLGTTAAGVSVGGQITSRKVPLKGVTVMITGGSLTEPRYTKTNSFGYYSFEGLAAGQTYVVTAISNRYTFTQSSNVLNVEDNVSGADFEAEDR
jgi:hypothetical protein